MTDILKVAGIQTELFWESRDKNLQNFDRLISSISKPVDLIVLPEMFSTGFTMNPTNVAETMNGKTVQWMKSQAKNNSCAIVGSVVIKEGEKFYNRSLFIFPEGNIEAYDKRHTFTLAGEDKVYTSGKSKLLVNYKGWKICPFICYDLRFPVWSRNVKDYDLLIYMANWPKPRINAWDILLKARAVENMSYTIGVNRIGNDKNDYEYSGHSKIIDCLGNILLDSEENQEEILSYKLIKSTQDTIRNKLNFLNDRDQFTIQGV